MPLERADSERLGQHIRDKSNTRRMGGVNNAGIFKFLDETFLVQDVFVPCDAASAEVLSMCM